MLGFTVALAAITYLDRVCIAHAQITGAIQRELGLSDRQMGLVFSAFTLAYALFEIPTGAWGDRIGARRVLTRIVAWWSFFTMLTAAAFNYGSLLLVRFLFGAGEAGAFPNVTRTFSRWFPVAERGTAQGIFFAGAHLSGGLTPILVTALLGFLPWRAIFVVFGAIGFVWAFAWYRWFRDEPADHPDAGPEEVKYIESGRMPGGAPSARRRGPPAHPDGPEPGGALPDVLHAGVRLLLQHHVAADLPGEAGPDGGAIWTDGLACWRACR